MNAAYFVDDTRVSWGRVMRARHYVAKPRFADQIAAMLAQAHADGRRALAVGLGRSYGDSNLNPDGALIDLTGLDRLIAFDEVNGVLRVEAGASLSSILRFLVPRGWFLPTTPGTRFVTIGGAIANDVHGKNHQSAGSIGCWVRRIGLVRSDRGALELAADQDGELFAATIGGLGLTGIISWVELQLVRIASAFIDQDVAPLRTLDEFFELSTSGSFEHSAAWIDCTARGDQVGKGVLLRGNWSKEGDLIAHAETPMITVPLDGASIAFNPVFLRVANGAYRAAQLLRDRQARVHYESHLFPLDAIGSWNRLYGSRGFYQYQCVVPLEHRDAIGEMLNAIANAGAGSILVVLKLLGSKRSPGLVSFPMPGVTLAMDFVNTGERLHQLFAQLDGIVRAARGRLYLAKDGRVPAAMFQDAYPEWRRFALQVDPALSSAAWRRVSQ